MRWLRLHNEIDRRTAKHHVPEQIGRCRDCEWWDAETGATVGLCSAIGDATMRLDTGSRARIPQETGGMIFLETDATFGCVEFRAKQAESPNWPKGYKT